jgi:ubiquinone/menaquinone biosynthesis C-methylase UbiE
VHADFDDLPFAARQFDAVVFNGSLHYAPDTVATLVRAGNLLTPGGVLAVVDSPLFDAKRDGELMCRRNADRFRRDYGLASAHQPGEGYVTPARLGDGARALGREAHFFESHGPVRWALGRQYTRWWRHQEPPRFGVWIAT